MFRRGMNQRTVPRSEVRDAVFVIACSRAGLSGPDACHHAWLFLLTQARVPYPQPGVMSRREDDDDIEASEREPLTGEPNDSPAPPRCVPPSDVKYLEC